VWPNQVSAEFLDLSGLWTAKRDAAYIGTIMADRALMHKNTNQNRECGIVTRQTDKKPALLSCYRQKTNPPAGMNQRAPSTCVNSED
jgi:hypothetical protein